MRKLGSERKLHAHVLIPVRQGVSLKAEDCLHGITQHAGTQALGREPHNGVLDLRAVLVLVDDHPIVRCGQDISNMTIPK
jgi:hypothetical protein